MIFNIWTCSVKLRKSAEWHTNKNKLNWNTSSDEQALAVYVTNKRPAIHSVHKMVTADFPT